jgi:2-desacetyl-2-hydroxyethyl bacteriochlorophyllide A dehydrogenase
VSASNPTVVFPRRGEVVLEALARPAPGAGELLVRSEVTLISPGTELTILRGAFEPGSAWASYGRYPFHPGYSSVGLVEELGDGLDPVWLGRRVASYGRHARFAAVPLAVVRPLPDGVPSEQAALFTLAETVLNGLRRARLVLGEHVAIFGAGLLGQLAARFACLAGAGSVSVVDVRPERLARLPAGPELHALDPRAEPPQDAVRRITRGRMADVVFELTGDPELIPPQIAALRPQGRFVVLSSPRGGGTRFDFHDLCNAISIEIIGAHTMSSPPLETPQNPWTRARHAELFFELVASGRVEVASLITRRVPPSAAPDAYRSLLAASGDDLGVVIDWHAPE